MTEERRVALVSGGNRGIGLEICRQLAARDYTVVLGARDEQQGQEAAGKLEGDVRAYQLDVSDATSIERVGRFIEEEFGRLDALVNNAGISNDDGQRGADANLDRVREALEANFLGAWGLCEVAILLMRKNGYGRIVNISSGLGALEDMGGGSPGYRVSKTALNALTRILSSELRSEHPRQLRGPWLGADRHGGIQRLTLRRGRRGYSRVGRHAPQGRPDRRLLPGSAFCSVVKFNSLKEHLEFTESAMSEKRERLIAELEAEWSRGFWSQLFGNGG